MKSLLLGSLIISFFNIFSQDSCVVKVFPGDCQNCYIGIKKVESTPEGIKKTIVFPDLSKAEVNAYLTNVLGISDINEYTVIVSDSIYNSLNNNLTSEIYIFKENKPYDHTLLKNFYGIDELGFNEIEIPDSIAISIGATIINHKDYFFITDPKFGNCIFISKYNNHEIKVLTARKLTIESNFEKISGDTICYFLFNQYKEVLKSANMDRMQLKSTFGKRDLMASFILVPDIKVINKEAGLTYKYGIIKFSNPTDYIILSIDEGSLPGNYVVSPGFYFEYKGNYYIQITNIDRTIDDQYVLGKFQLKNDRLVFSGFPDYKIPPEYLPASKFMSLRKILSSAIPYIFLQYSRSYYDLDKNKTYILPLDSANLTFELPDLDINRMKFEYNFNFIDVLVMEKTIQVLYEESGKFFIAIINRSDNTLVKRTEISNPAKPIKAGMYFYSANKLFYLTEDNTIVVEKIIYK